MRAASGDAANVKQLNMAIYDTVHDFPGGANALAGALGMASSTLRSKVNSNAHSHELNVREADRIMAVTGCHDILHALAARHGFVCVPLESCESEPCDAATLEIVMRCWRHHGDVGKAVEEAVADGRIERHEVDRVRGCVYVLIMTMMMLLMSMEKQVK